MATTNLRDPQGGSMRWLGHPSVLCRHASLLTSSTPRVRQAIVDIRLSISDFSLVPRQDALRSRGWVSPGKDPIPGRPSQRLSRKRHVSIQLTASDWLSLTEQQPTLGVWCSPAEGQLRLPCGSWRFLSLAFASQPGSSSTQ